MRKPVLIALIVAGCALAISATRHASGDNGDADQPPKVVRQIYDIRDYLAKVGNYPLRPSPTIRPATRPYFKFPVPGMVPFNPVDHIYVSNIDEPVKHKIDDLIAFIMMNVAPDSWAAAGGSYGDISVINERLFVTQTPEAQAEIQKIVARITGSSHQGVHVRACWLLLTDDGLSAARQPRPEKPDDSVIGLSDQALQKITPIARADLACLDGQTVHITAGSGQTHIKLQIQPRISSAKGHVIVDVLNSVADSEEFHTTARIPLGQEVVIGGITAVAGGKDQPKQLYLVMRVDSN